MHSHQRLYELLNFQYNHGKTTNESMALLGGGKEAGDGQAGAVQQAGRQVGHHRQASGHGLDEDFGGTFTHDTGVDRLAGQEGGAVAHADDAGSMSETSLAFRPCVVTIDAGWG